MNRFEITNARLTRDPEVKYTPTQTAICNLLLATDRYVKGEKKTDFPRVTVFGKDAENLDRLSGKGLRVNVFGRIETGSYMKGEDTIYTTTLYVRDSRSWTSSQTETNTHQTSSRE